MYTFILSGINGVGAHKKMYKKKKICSYCVNVSFTLPTTFILLIPFMSSPLPPPSLILSSLSSISIFISSIFLQIWAILYVIVSRVICKKGLGLDNDNWFSGFY